MRRGADFCDFLGPVPLTLENRWMDCCAEVLNECFVRLAGGMPIRAGLSRLTHFYRDLYLAASLTRARTKGWVVIQAPPRLTTA